MTAHPSRSLDEYLESAFQAPCASPPLEDESHVTWWRDRFRQEGGTAQSLVDCLAQFQIAIAPGASASSDYVRFIRQGEPIPGSKSAKDLFSSPRTVNWEVVDHWAGGLPVITFTERPDFERAYRALGARCEPISIGTNVHALYVGGLPNPVRAAELKADFIESGNDVQAWSGEMKRRMQSDATCFHDRLILLHPAPYGGLSPSTVAESLDDHAWVQASMQLRIEHECTHHATHRLLGSYRLHVHDELLADLMGFTKAIGRFEADLFLRALGVQAGRIAPDARLLAYTSDLEVSSLPRLVEILSEAARSVESISSVFVEATQRERFVRFVALSQIDIASLATLNSAELESRVVGGSTG